MKEMRWFRVWTDIVDDEKLRLLSPADRWYYVGILALKRAGILDAPGGKDVFRDPDDSKWVPRMVDRKVGVKLQLTERETAEVLRRLMDVDLVDGDWHPIGWGNRQFESDNSTARVQEFRKRNVKRSGNVSETPSETETETETETERKPARKRASRRCPESFSPDLQYAKSQVPDIDAQREAQKFRDWEFKTPRSDWAATWRTWIQNCRESGKYARQMVNGQAREAPIFR
jgi:hypothetical protein